MNEIRPISPHLSIYKLQVTSAFSIAHRITGLYIFLYMLAVINLCLFKLDAIFMKSPFCIQAFIILTCLFNFALAFHLAVGLRYLIWGLGIGVNLNFVTKSIVPLLIAIGFLGGVSSYLLIKGILL